MPQPGAYVLTALVLLVLGCVAFAAAGLTALYTKLQAARAKADRAIAERTTTDPTHPTDGQLLLIDSAGRIVDWKRVGIKARLQQDPVTLQRTCDRDVQFIAEGDMAAIELRDPRGECFMRMSFSTYLAYGDFLTVSPAW
ncbi:hypothetical protein ACIA7S_28660 [Streptomyces sp. NPDC051643]|uniref:hypothetical protein n=1 Tax=Streptomyces sp. NPDC051643 TaxID=3365665 RepID=UPI0037A60BC5